MNKKQIFAMMAVGALQLSSAQAVVLENFENYAIGTKIALWNCWGNNAGMGEVVADPANASNKVLKVKITGWGTFAGVTLPDDLQGKALVEEKTMVTFRIYRSQSDQNDYKKVQVYQDNALLFEDEGYPHQGDKGVWQQRTYSLPKTADGLSYGSNGGKVLAVGFNSDASEYLIDDIAVKGEYDDYETIEGKVEKSCAMQNTDKSYQTMATSYRMMPGAELTLKTARYTHISGNVIGEGTINIYSGGERTYIGDANKKYPDWTGYRGDVHIYPYKELSSSNGFYGIVWAHNGKTFSPSTAITDMSEAKPCNTWIKSRVVLHQGATLAAESGTRGIRIGHLDTEAGSQVYGHSKSSSTSHSYYILGNTGDDAVLAGRISPVADNMAMKLGIFKEGLGTYRITGNTNLITGGLTVLRGRVLVNNDAAAAKAQKLSGGIGSGEGLLVRKDGIAGGTGSIAATTNVYGILQPGDDGIGTLTFADYAKGQKPVLILRPTARIDCEIGSKDAYDKVVVDGPVSYYNINQEYEETDQMPRLRIQLAEGAELHEGDEFTLLEATGKQAYQNVEWQFDIVYPKAYTWQVDQQKTDGGFKVVARVTSVEYGGQGDKEDVDDGPDASSDDGIFDIAEEMNDASTTLRSFVDGRDMYVGTCVPVWSINVDNDKESRSALIAKEYNMVVAENEMKFDATEPSRGSFDYSNGDRLVNFAKRHNMRVRGHALAWHSQVPGWLTADGLKNTRNFSREELLDILHNHIKNVVTRWKGKVAEWDVANEVLDDDQSSITKNPKAYDLRPSVWATGIGEDFLDSAFVWAHKYDPDAKLILNDYGVEGKGWGKSEALYNLAMRLKNNNIPIDGVGLQSHMDAGLPYASSIDANIKRFQDAGLECHITELDLGISDKSADNLQMQAETYYAITRIAMKYDNCKSLMIWGLSDDLTWRPGKSPLLFDSSLAKKPAYWGVHAALRQSAGKELTDVEAPLAEAATEVPASAVVYNLQGQRVTRMVKGQIYIIGNKKVAF